MLKKMPKDIVVHRLSGTASDDILLAPKWCGKKWAVLNAIHESLEKSLLPT
jgi:radical SAM superfamily enzyme